MFPLPGAVAVSVALGKEILSREVNLDKWFPNWRPLGVHGLQFPPAWPMARAAENYSSVWEQLA